MFEKNCLSFVFLSVIAPVCCGFNLKETPAFVCACVCVCECTTIFCQTGKFRLKRNVVELCQLTCSILFYFYSNV